MRKFWMIIKKSQYSMKRKTLIISLIRDDLINSKLVYGLGDMGLNADEYLLHLSETVFKLMGLDSTDQLTEHYLELTQRIRDIDIFDRAGTLEHLAIDIYHKLLLQKNVQNAVLNGHQVQYSR
jgi:hypothetical protein